MQTQDRPTDEQRAKALAQYEADRANPPDEVAMLFRAARGNPSLEALLREQFVAEAFLRQRLADMGVPAQAIDDECFTLGRLCFMNPDVWHNFDRLLKRAEDTMAKLTRRKEWANSPVPQDVPKPTTLLTEWWKYARNSVIEEGVFPMPMLHRDHSGTTTVEALALSGPAAFQRAIDTFESDPVELVIGIDHTAVAGQDLTFGDFLAVTWYVNGEFYTGIVEYQRRGSVPEPEFRPIRWDNNYWNHSLREYPIPAMQAKLPARCVICNQLAEGHDDEGSHGWGGGAGFDGEPIHPHTFTKGA